jgi:glycerophosphoryl diester phosphodiesterase
VSSAGIHGLTRTREIAGEIALQWSVYTLDIAAETAAAADAGIDVISPQDYAATEANFARAHGRGLAVHIYTRGEDERMAKLIEMGADAVKTGRPDALRAVAGRLGRI